VYHFGNFVKQTSENQHRSQWTDDGPYYTVCGLLIPYFYIPPALDIKQLQVAPQIFPGFFCFSGVQWSGESSCKVDLMNNDF